MSYIFDVQASNVSNANTITISPTAGDLIVLTCASTGGVTPTITVADNIGSDAWIVPLNNATGTVYQVSIAYLINCPAGITTLTVTFSGGTPGIVFLSAVAYKNISSASFISVTALNSQTAPGTGTNAITSAALNVTSEPAILLGYMIDNTVSGTTSAGTGFTKRVSNPSSSGTYVEDIEVLATGNAFATFTNATGTNTYNTWALAFIESTAAANTATIAWVS
jgi:hypothetical protein